MVAANAETGWFSVTRSCTRKFFLRGSFLKKCYNPRMKKFLIIFGVIALIIIVAVVYLRHRIKANIPPVPTVTVVRGNVIEHAQAIGHIKPNHSSTVKSSVDGSVAEIYHYEGEYVKKGELLLKVKPEPEPSSYAETYENLQEEIAIETSAKKNLDRYKSALKSGLITSNYSDYITAQQSYATAHQQRILAEQKLALLDQGTTKVGNKNIANIVTSPIDGYILTRNVDVGDPVISLSSAQASTALFTMANMKDIIFEGSVDEMDAAKVHLQMPAVITIGANPEAKITGELTMIDLQSEQENALTGSDEPDEDLPFDVSFRVQVTKLKFPQGYILRSGYSATAEVKVDEANNVLILPERVLHFRGDKVFVLLPPLKPEQKPVEQPVTLGLSDGLNSEIKSGLHEGDKVLDKSASSDEQ
jgi:HlyD family secretion protein